MTTDDKRELAEACGWGYGESIETATGIGTILFLVKIVDGVRHEYRPWSDDGDAVKALEAFQRPEFHHWSIENDDGEWSVELTRRNEFDTDVIVCECGVQFCVAACAAILAASRKYEGDGRMSKVMDDLYATWIKNKSSYELTLKDAFSSGWRKALQAAAKNLENAPGELFTLPGRIGFARAAEMLRSAELEWPGDEPDDFTKESM